jgi:AraC-like DNA-binding protein
VSSGRACQFGPERGNSGVALVSDWPSGESIAWPRIESSRFSVEELPSGQRHEAWSNRSWPSLSPLYETQPIGEFNATAVSYALGDIKLWYPRITAQTYLRTPVVARRHGHDDLSLFMGWAGSAVGEAGERSYHRAPGDLIFMDLAQPDRQRANGDDGVSLLIPRALAETTLPPVETLHGLVVSAGHAALVSALLQGMRGTLGGLDQSALPRLRRVLLDLLAVTLANAGVPTIVEPAARQLTLAMRARREIDAGLGSAALSVASLCRRLGVSRSTLHRAFQSDGGIEAYIRNRRLDAVHAALGDTSERRPIGELADAFGFSDGAHLSRLFRARYAMTPTEFRLSFNG